MSEPPNWRKRAIDIDTFHFNIGVAHNCIETIGCPQPITIALCCKYTSVLRQLVSQRNRQTDCHSVLPSQRLDRHKAVQNEMVTLIRPKVHHDDISLRH